MVSRVSRQLIVFSLLILITGKVMGQAEEESPRKFFFGGNFDLIFGNITCINVSPLAGYRITPRLSSGTGLSYEYYREKLTSSDIYQTSMYGARVFTSYDVIPDISKFVGLSSQGALMGYLEYEALNYDSYQRSTRIWLHNVYAGGGLRIPAGERAAFQLLILYNLNETIDSPYTNPLFRIGFTF